MSKSSKKGRFRLCLMLGAFGGVLCVAAMGLVLVLYGFPYNTYWWGVMTAILVASFLNPVVTVPAIEWVIEGYIEGDHR